MESLLPIPHARQARPRTHSLSQGKSSGRGLHDHAWRWARGLGVLGLAGPPRTKEGPLSCLRPRRAQGTEQEQSQLRGAGLLIFLQRPRFWASTCSSLGPLHSCAQPPGRAAMRLTEGSSPSSASSCCGALGGTLPLSESQCAPLWGGHGCGF